MKFTRTFLVLLLLFTFPVIVPATDLPDPTCNECDGKVTNLTLQFLSDVAGQVRVVQKKTEDVVFDSVVNPGDTFSVAGVDKKGTLGTEISIYVDDVLNTRLHTSCSKPIGPGTASGSFLVTESISRNGGNICPLPTPDPLPNPDDPTCSECAGKVITMTLRYDGDTAANITVEQKKGNIVIFSDTVPVGGEFIFVGVDKKGTLGTEIRVYINGNLNTKIHTSCSKPVGPGIVAGDFMIVEAASHKGGNICPLGDVGTPPISGCRPDICDPHLLLPPSAWTVHFTSLDNISTHVFNLIPAEQGENETLADFDSRVDQEFQEKMQELANYVVAIRLHAYAYQGSQFALLEAAIEELIQQLVDNGLEAEIPAALAQLDVDWWNVAGTTSALDISITQYLADLSDHLWRQFYAQRAILDIIYNGTSDYVPDYVPVEDRPWRYGILWFRQGQTCPTN